MDTDIVRSYAESVCSCHYRIVVLSDISACMYHRILCRDVRRARSIITGQDISACVEFQLSSDRQVIYRQRALVCDRGVSGDRTGYPVDIKVQRLIGSTGIASGESADLCLASGYDCVGNDISICGYRYVS